jgi:trigger factor
LQKNIKNVSETEQVLEIILSAEEFGAEYSKELEEAKRNVQIKGFRKGHAPASLIKKLAGPSIETTVAEKMASKYFGEIADSGAIKPINRAEIISFSFEDDQLILRLAYEIQPEFELNDFSEYSFTKALYTVTDEDVEREIQQILKAQATLISVDEAASTTDTVIGDVWKLNDVGEPKEDSVTENHHFTLEYLPEENPFRRALLGKKRGESIDVENKKEETDAEPSTFRVIVREIKRLELPELTDDLVKEVTEQQFESAADLRSDIRNQIEANFIKLAEEDLLESISEKLIEANPVSAPESMVGSFTQMLVDNAKRQIGGAFPSSFDEKDFLETLRPNAVKHAQWMVISRKIAETENITVSEDDLKAYVEKEISENPSLDKERLLESYKTGEIRDFIAESVIKKKIYDLLKSKVTITEEERLTSTREV